VKFLCPACERLTAFSGFRTDGDLLVLRCSRCGAESGSRASTAEGTAAIAASPLPGVAAAPAPALGRPADALSIPPAEPAANAEPWSVPDGHCPKCVAPRPAQASSCAQCGLAFANFNLEALEPSPALAEQFQHLLSNWEDIDKHDRLIQAALVQGELATVGRLYRIRLARAPQDAYAARGRDEVLRLATAGSAGLSTAESTQGPRGLGRWKYLVLSAIVAACGIAFFGLYRQLVSAIR
jgi:hypothetical protein